MPRGERQRLLRGPLRTREVERHQVLRLPAGEHVAVIGGDGELDFEAARGLDEGRGPVGRAGKQEEEARAGAHYFFEAVTYGLEPAE